MGGSRKHRNKLCFEKEEDGGMTKDMLIDFIEIDEPFFEENSTPVHGRPDEIETVYSKSPKDSSESDSSESDSSELNYSSDDEDEEDGSSHSDASDSDNSDSDNSEIGRAHV